MKSLYNATLHKAVLFERKSDLTGTLTDIGPHSQIQYLGSWFDWPDGNSASVVECTGSVEMS